MAARELPSPDILRQLLRYEPETGKLYWRERSPSLFKRPGKAPEWNAKFAGTEAFTAIGTHGYRVGNVLQHCLLAHRVIVAMRTGQWPVSVDHDNRIKLDNRWTNLIPGTHGDNKRNLPLRRDNKSGQSGVCFVAQAQRWRARIHDEQGRPVHLGDFTLLADAIHARKAAEERLGYHPNHGRAGRSTKAT